MKKISLLIIMSVLLSFTVISANDEGEEYLAFTDEMPSPVGGIKAIYSEVEYPSLAKSAGVQGKVYILAFISETGDVDDVKVIKGIGGGCDEAAVAAVKGAKFNPGKKEGTPVKVKYSLPIVFKLN